MVVEGERAADALATHLDAEHAGERSPHWITTSAHGAANAAQSDWLPLDGRDVII